MPIKSLSPPLLNIYYQIVHRPVTVCIHLFGSTRREVWWVTQPRERTRQEYLFTYLFLTPKKTHTMWKWVVLRWPALQVSSTEETASGTSGLVPPTSWPLSQVKQGAAWAAAVGLWPSEAYREANRSSPGNCEVWQQLWNRDQRQQQLQVKCVLETGLFLLNIHQFSLSPWSVILLYLCGPHCFLNFKCFNSDWCLNLQCTTDICMCIHLYRQRNIYVYNSKMSK